MANLELRVPITPASVFHAASVAKPFTAMSVLLLARQGRFSLDDELRKYITQLPDYGSRLTIRHLLSHTGGLRDVFQLQGLAATRAGGGEPNDEFVDILAHQGIRVIGGRPKPFVIDRVSPAPPSSAELRALAGDYWSSELGVTYSVVAQYAALTIRIPGRSHVVAQPILRDTFAGELVGIVRFSRDAHGAVTGFTVNTLGVQRLRFERVRP